MIKTLKTVLSTLAIATIASHAHTALGYPATAQPLRIVAPAMIVAPSRGPGFADITEAASKAISEHDDAVRRIRDAASTAAQERVRRCQAALLAAVAEEKRSNNLDGMLAIEAQLDSLDSEVAGLPRSVRTAVDTYRNRQKAEAETLTYDVCAEHRRLIKRLEDLIAEETRLNHLRAAAAIDSKREQLLALVANASKPEGQETPSVDASPPPLLVWPAYQAETQSHSKPSKETARILSDYDHKIARISKAASKRLSDHEETCHAALAKEIHAAQVNGRFDAISAIQRQRENLDRIVDGLPGPARAATTAYQGQRDPLLSQLVRDANTEHERVSAQLDTQKRREMLSGNLLAAVVINGWQDDRLAQHQHFVGENRKRQFQGALIGSWDVKIGSYTSVWTFSEDGTVSTGTQITGPKIKRKRSGGKQGTYAFLGDDIVIRWGTGAWEELHIPINDKKVAGTSYPSEAELIADKKADP